jgi:hypothetical protein
MLYTSEIYVRFMTVLREAYAMSKRDFCQFLDRLKRGHEFMSGVTKKTT